MQREAVICSEASANCYQTTKPHIREDDAYTQKKNCICYTADKSTLFSSTFKQDRQSTYKVTERSVRVAVGAVEN